MRLLVTGSRRHDDRKFIFSKLDNMHSSAAIELLIEGGARGADAICREWAKLNGIPVATFEANWNFYGPGAGAVRNHWMLIHGKPEWVMAFPLDGSKGTWHMVKAARADGICVTVEQPDGK